MHARAAHRCTFLAALASLFVLSCDSTPRAMEPDKHEGPFAREEAGRALSSDAGSMCTTFVADPLIEHSCFHAMEGPYRHREADATAPLARDVSRAHTVFRISLPERPDGSFGGTLGYHARAAGGYAFFTHAGVEVSLGASLAPFSAHDTEICHELPRVTAYALDEGDYALSLSSLHAEVLLVIEYMDEGERHHAYRSECSLPDADGDVQDDRASRPSDGGAPDAGWADGGIVDQVDSDAGDVDTGEQDAGAACQVDSVLEHACLHVRHGPHGSVTASSASGSAPDVNAAHTAFTVRLGGSQLTSYVTYRPTSSAQHVFYLGKDVGLTLTDPTSDTLLAEYEEPVVGCEGLVAARVFSLEAATRYLVALGPTGATSTLLMIENVHGLASGWEDRRKPCF